MANNNPTHVVTETVRFSYMHVFQPYAQRQDQEPKYSTTVLVPKSDLATKARIDAAIEAAKMAGASKNWGGAVPPILAICVHDGDGPRPSDGMPFGEECRGHWVFTASSKQPPKVVDAQLQPIMNPNDVQSGDYGKVSVDFFPYNAGGKKGIGCGLQNLMKTADGEPLGNRTSVEDDFGGMAPQPSAPPAYASPAGYQQPAPAPQAAPPAYQPTAAPAPAANPFAVPGQGGYLGQ